MKTTPEKYLTATPPDCLLGTVARERWTTTIETLADEERKLPKSNEGILLAYCSAFQLLADCDADLLKRGLLVDGGRDGVRRSPALAGKLQALTSIRNCAAELGLSPASANRLPLPPLEKPYNPLTELLRKPD